MVEDCMRKWTPRYLPIRRLPGFVYRCLSLIVVKWAERRLHLRFASVLNSFGDARHIAFLFIHGKGDRYIPESQVSEFYRRAERARARHLWLVPKAGHNESAKVEPENYAVRVSKFFTTSLRGSFEFELVTRSTAEALQ
jgi:hypothetical protein